jgi:hypothetical protein
MRIAILVEGKTEMAFKPYLQDFLRTRLAGPMPKLDFCRVMVHCQPMKNSSESWNVCSMANETQPTR